MSNQMMFDTHCHLNFSRFKKNVEEVIAAAKDVGVEYIVIPGTDVPTSQKAREIAQSHEGLYAAVGIHPHHVYEMKDETVGIEDHIKGIEKLLSEKKIVAVGEIGMDRHVYEETKYQQYNIDEHFIDVQKVLLKEQIKLAVTYKKSLILHNREAKEDLLPIVDEAWDSHLRRHAVFHCCEPDEELLKFAQSHKMFIGVDGDITYYKEKQEYIKTVPLDMLVLETDSPFLLPEPMRSQKLFPNQPKNIPFIAEFIARLRNEDLEIFARQTTENAKELFDITKT